MKRKTVGARFESLEPRQFLSGDVIVDNAAAALTGAWSSSTATPGYNGADYLTDNNANKGADSATFVPALPSAGVYKVYVFYTAGTDRSSSVPVDIATINGRSTARVNEQARGGTWVALGDYTLDPVTVSVTIRNDGTTGAVVADAVKFSLEPTATTFDDTDSHVTRSGTWTNSTTTPGFYKSDYLVDSTGGAAADAVTFPVPVTGGAYHVYAQWTAGADRANNVPIDITQGATTTTVYVNQQQHGGSFQLLGNYNFAAGTVKVVVRTAGTTGLVVADAVKLAPVTLAEKESHAFAFAGNQLKQTIADLGNNTSLYPNHTQSDGTWTTDGPSDWTSGFFPGALWQMNKATADPYWTTQATAWTTPLSGQASVPEDIFSRIAAPYAPLYAATNDPSAQQILINAAAAKMTRYNATVGAFQTTWRPSSSGNKLANFGVLMDQTMDMADLFYAAKQTNNAAWAAAAAAEMQTVETYMVRPDGSTAQWAYFNSSSGQFIDQETFQGYSSSSAWSRGQGWAIYSFGVAYQQTGRADFLATAEKAADYFLSHLPADSIPYWDFNAPVTATTVRDTSAASIAASGLLQLAKLEPDAAHAAKYKAAANAILNSLASPAYLAEGTSSHGVLLHAAASVPTSTPVPDTTWIAGDYYVLEAMNRSSGR